MQALPWFLLLSVAVIWACECYAEELVPLNGTPASAGLHAGYAGLMLGLSLLPGLVLWVAWLVLSSLL